MNRRTWPKRCVSQPVSGTAMALATAKLVMTQVPCVRADAQVAGDGRQRDVGDRRVEHVHEGRGRQRDRAPDAGRALERRQRRAAAAEAVGHRRDVGSAPAARATVAGGRRLRRLRRGPRVPRRRRAAQVGGDDARRPRRRRRGRARCRPASAISAAARGASASILPSLLRDVDLGVHRQADAQRIGLELLGVERDAHRHALHHLDPVAGGVLRRQQREGGAGADAEAGDRAVVLDLLAVDVGRAASPAGRCGCCAAALP